MDHYQENCAMKAVAVSPGQANSAHLREIPTPTLEDIPDGRGVLVKVLRVGLDGTDREINAAEYGTPPPRSDFLVLGHESFGIVQQVGPQVTQLAAGDHVVALVRHPGDSWYDAIGMPDMSTDSKYYEHGISLLHGFLTEYYADVPEQLVSVPAELRGLGVLVEPLSIAEKGVFQAYEIQRRLRVWRPMVAAVLGAGTIGLLATLVLRLRGLKVVTLALEEPPYLNSELVEALGAHYLSTSNMTLADASAKHGPFDLMFEATGFSPLVFEAMGVLGQNGVLILSSVTGGDRRVEVPADSLNLGFVLGNKVMVGTVNAGRENYEAAVRDLVMTESQYPGWLSRLLTHPVNGLDNYDQAFRLLTGGSGPIKVFIEVAPLT
jgi:threonine dehydrogenase-like Zn-dependent dehydrogenase